MLRTDFSENCAVGSFRTFNMEKNKEKKFDAYNKGNAKTKRMNSDTYEQVNNAVLKWFTRIRAENVPVSGILIKEKALYFAKE